MSKENKTEIKKEEKSDEILFETIYEKVIHIINKVKDIIKKTLSKEKELIEELDWVIKVIENRSLYNYELKEKLTKQNEEYNKYINFIKKYNEEVIEMNKKHDIVSGILNMKKKESILIKPSLLLKKMDNINKVGEIKIKKKNNFIYTFGNYILNLYNEKNKKKVNFVGNNNNENVKQDIEKEKEENNKQQNSEGNNKLERKQNNNEIIPKHQKIYLENKIEGPDNKKMINIHKVVLENKNQKKILSPKLSPNYPEFSKRMNIKLTKAEKNNFNTIKNIMRNLYLNFAYTNEQFITNAYPNLYKIDLKQNSNIFHSDTFKRYKNNREKTYRLFKENKQFSSPYTNKNNNTKRNKILNFQSNYDSTDEKLNTNNYNVNKSTKNHFNKDKILDLNKKNDNSKRGIIKNRTSLVKYNKNINNEMKLNNDNIEINNKKEEQKVSLEILINNNVDELKDITSYDFNIFELKKKVGYDNVLPIMGYTILKTLGLIDNKIIVTKKLESFLRTVSNNYKITTLYHNSLHGADVTQSLFVFFLNSNSEEICETTVLDILGMIISALGHDLGHPGLNNGYHINASTDLGITYNDQSCLENFHSSFLFKIIRKEENNILEKFSVQNYKTIRKRMISQILATDMANHGQNISLIRAKIKACKDEDTFTFLSGNEKTKFDEQQLLLNYLIHMADLGHNCKKFNICIIWIQLLCEEFWLQGDKEKEKGLSISFMCDRNKIDVPSSQIGFLKGFILSSFDCLVAMFPKLKFTIDNAEDNIKHWTKYQNEKRLLGWTPEKNKKKENKEEEE